MAPAARASSTRRLKRLRRTKERTIIANEINMSKTRVAKKVNLNVHRSQHNGYRELFPIRASIKEMKLSLLGCHLRT